MARVEDWEEELSRPDSFPGAAVVVCVAVLIAAGVGLLPRIGYPPFWQILCGALLLALVLWIIAFIATIRHAAIAWKIGSLGALVVVAGAIALAGFVYNNMRLREDVRTIAEVRFMPDGTPSFARGAEDRGPISRLFITMVKEAAEDRKKFDGEAIRLGVNILANPFSLEQNPTPLKACGDLAGLKTLAADNATRQVGRLKAFVAGVEATDVPEEFKKGVRDSFARDDSSRRLVKMGETMGVMVDAIQAKCVVLARKHWTPEYNQFSFSSGPDLVEFNRNVERHQKALADLNRLEADGRAKMQRGQAQLNRALKF